MAINTAGFVREDYNDGDISIHVIDIKEITPELKETIDTHITRICDGPEDYGITLSTIKKKVKRFLENKAPDDEQDDSKYTFTGAISEFFIHLFLNHIGFQQECIYLNLEENSIKKGFDGYYTIDGASWIMESKSGSSKTKNISHSSKVALSYNQLKNKITASDYDENDPWSNAFNHAQRVNSSADLLKELKKFSEQFINEEINNKLEDFNLIPCSTIFYYQDWEEDKQQIIDEIKEKINDYEYKNIKVICINKRFLNSFMTYLEND